MDIAPAEIKAVMIKYHISGRKRRDILSLLIADRVGANIFVHENPKDFIRDEQIRQLIKKENIGVKIVQLPDAISEIKEYINNRPPS